MHTDEGLWWKHLFVVVAIAVVAGGATACSTPSEAETVDRAVVMEDEVVRLSPGEASVWAEASGRDVVEVDVRIDAALVSGIKSRRGVTVVEWEGVGRGRLSADRQHVAMSWAWADGVQGPRSIIQLPALPATGEGEGDVETLTLRWEWDAEAARFYEFIAGHAQRGLDVRFPDGWELPGGGALSVPHPDGGPLPIRVMAVRVGRVETLPRSEPRPSLDRLFGVSTPPAINVAGRLGAVIYENDFAAADAVADWVVEGPMRTTLEDGKLFLESTKPDAQRPDHGHGVFWPPVELPDAYVVDWTFSPRGRPGLAIVFFDTQANLPGRPGVTDLFAPAMPARDGTFSQYWNGPIDAYHLSYFADTPDNPGRGYSNLRKDPGLTLMAVGQPAISADTTAPVRLRLVREGPRIQLLADGRVVIDTTDDAPERFGSALNGGRLGFRQMQWTRGEYDDLTVRELLPTSP